MQIKNQGRCVDQKYQSAPNSQSGLTREKKASAVREKHNMLVLARQKKILERKKNCWIGKKIKIININIDINILE